MNLKNKECFTYANLRIMEIKRKLLEIINDQTSPIIDILSKEKVYDFINSKSNYKRPWFGQLMAGPQLMAYYIQLDYWMRKYKLELP